ncbi:phage terminase large subunit family protein [Burkholderia territorii]|uniref:phage terminase large subunit family protein n=1 Tax=Burkholderia territorii TaxID=1503055 RepID=UPI0007542124|nr:phage terminase large subunit family protein [Burkholderia territorii]KVL49974.1 hypothetical protein WT00_18665 [Burkholderia territorii]
MSNQYLQQLYERAANRWSKDRASMTYGDWICENTTHNDRAFSFKRYPFQKQIADDMHDNLDCIKPSQVGLTEVQIRKVLAFIARNRGVNVIYTLPDEAMMERISVGRVRPLVDEEHAFNLESLGGKKPTRTKEIIQVGKSFLYLTAAGEGAATSISADMVVNDEVDLTDQSMLALFNSRLQGSDWKLNHRFSTPTFQDYGIDQTYKVSDQHEYMLKCACCNHWQVPDFERPFVRIPGLPDSLDFEEIEEAMIDAGTVDLDAVSIHCEHCGAPLNLGDHERRAWVPKYPQRKHARGYRVRAFSTERLPPKYILRQLFIYKRKDFIRGWYNTVLGRSHTGGDQRLNDADINAAFTEFQLVRPSSNTMPAWIGIDIGQTCHIVVGEGYDVSSIHVVEFLTVPVGRLLEEIARILTTYRIVAGGCDRHPYTPTAEAVRDVSHRRVLPNEYRGSKEINLVKDPAGEITHMQSNRTLLLDEVARAIRLRKIKFSGYGTHRSAIVEHLKDMVRNEEPEKEAEWKKLNGNDHFFHALGFMLSAVKLHTTNASALFNTETRSVIQIVGATVGMNETSQLTLANTKHTTGNLIYGNDHHPQVFF